MMPSDEMASSKVRRAHRKTRTGCTNCKRRRIKCDEQKPSCSKCIQRGFRCGYLTRHPECDSPVAAATDSPQPPAPTHELPMRELQLLHHFTTSTYATLSPRGHVKTIWRVTVPKLAFSSDCLMRAILALSALHLSRLEGDLDHQAHAIGYYDAALRSSTLAMLNISPETCSALYVCSELIFIFHLVHPYLSGNPLLSPNNEVAPWLVLLRGIRTIADPFRDALLTGVLGPMFGTEPSTPDTVIMDSLDTFTAHLRKTHPEADSDLHAYLVAIEELRRWSAGVDGHGFQWAVYVDESYISLLRQMKPAALVIFAHFARVVKKSDSNYWVHGWADRLVGVVYGTLDESYRLWIRPVLEEMGVAR
ncbi:hypothetical protein P170DRAFT_455630 [Aspergillus steynii IBT 23096]|uniref:Zn(2)-C6 fungal-type domain-containing protein n=1 Tax=Aspergillus steynii IBT 23096 TaxID=1392250 RepID=A0A2I2G767_9EURO|nr:uncharacterized protein P170DRAFT_455630 [Aspergillus steynii IBT 23096]PLB48726.1 hypothetical protein P170DRAFT_455630 [Aspergillus steynii IBT 23096]